MMKEIRTQIEIEASAERVWRILTDFEKYPEWNPFIKNISGSAQESNQLKVFIEPPGGKGMIFKPSVNKVEKYRKLSWLGHFLVPGIFDGEHIFEIIDVKESSLTFIQRENFTGLFVSLLWASIGENTKKGFMAMNQAIKQRAELRGDSESI